MPKDPKKHLTNIQNRQAEYLEAKVIANAKLEPKFLEFWLPSGATAKIPAHEVLTLRDLCDSWMAQNGAWDIMGREVDLNPPAQGSSETPPVPKQAGA